MPNYFIDIDDNVFETETLPQPYLPLDSVGVLTTLLVVLEVIDITVAANSLNVEEDHLIAEAVAWSLGG